MQLPYYLNWEPCERSLAKTIKIFYRKVRIQKAQLMQNSASEQ
nr:MAG TPA: hypothetical protein [Caudoviricetes sp.]